MKTVDDLDALAKALPPRERLFAEAYAGTARGHASRAAEIAGYKPGPGLKVTACRLLAKPSVRAYVDALLTANSRSQAEVIREISEIAFSDLSPYLETTSGGGYLSLNFKKMEEDGQLHLVAGFEFNKAGDSIPVLHSKHQALALLVKVLGMGKETVEHTGEVTTTIREYPEGV